MDQPFLIIEVACEFDLEEKTWESLRKENKIVFPRKFVEHLVVISLGTVRGVLHAKTEQTAFNSFFLPLTNVSKIITDDFLFEEE